MLNAKLQINSDITIEISRKVAAAVCTLHGANVRFDWCRADFGQCVFCREYQTVEGVGEDEGIRVGLSSTLMALVTSVTMPASLLLHEEKSARKPDET